MSLMDGIVTADRTGTWFDVGLIAALLVLCAAIAVVDWRHRIIPDVCNAAVGLLGLVYAGTAGFEEMLWALAQGGIIFFLFWLLRRFYRTFRRVQGLGLGDVKFLAAAGTWVGLQGIAPLLLVSCTAALAWLGTGLMRGHAVSAGHALPFGPFLVFGLVVVLGFSLQ